MMHQQQELTQALIQACDGDRAAADRLWEMVYGELRAVAHRQLLGERRNHTLSTTALVHEAYIRLVDQTNIAWQGRAHFFGVAARAMHQILIEYARRRNAQKRGGGKANLSLDEALTAADEDAAQLVELDDALQRLAQLNPRLADVVICRYFGGLTAEETAQTLQISVRTAHRDWIKAKGWLYQELKGG